MPSDEHFTPPRKKQNVLWWLGGVLVLLLLFFLFQLFGPSPPIVISPQTTYITKPLSADGLPDYEQFALDLFREGVTPDNNAAVLLYQALFPGDLAPQQHPAMVTELGLEAIPSAKDALVPVQHQSNKDSLAAWLAQQAETRPAVNSVAAFDTYAAVVDQVIEAAMRHPWTSEQIPPLARWAETNRVPLDLIVAATRRPRFYAPSPTLIDNKDNLLIEMLLPHAQSVREAERSLPTRAMLHLGEGRSMDAWQDLLAVHRLGRLLTQGHTLVEQLVAMAMSNSACDATLTLLHDSDLSVEQAGAVQRDLIALPTFSVVARSIDEGERLWAIDAFTHVGSRGDSDLFSAMGLENEGASGVLRTVSVDWNIVLRQTNRWYDRLSSAARKPNRAAREAAFAKINGDLLQLRYQLQTPALWVAGVFSRQERSELVAGMMLSLFLPALDAALDAEDRANTTLELTRLAAALTVYRVEHGVYPDNLDVLVPSVLDKLPVDLYNAKPFIYKRDGDGYLLYSAGDNGTDDGGSNEQMRIFRGRQFSETGNEAQLQQPIPAGADDVPICVPRLPLEPLKIDPNFHDIFESRTP